MATFIKAVLPSGRGIWLEKLTTKQYRAVNERVASRLGGDATPLQMTNRMARELLLSSLRGITKDVIPIQMTDDGKDVDIDKMLDGTPADAWLCPTFEQLITEGPLELDTLLEDPADYMTAEMIAGTETMGTGGQGSALRGKRKREFVER